MVVTDGVVLTFVNLFDNTYEIIHVFKPFVDKLEEAIEAIRASIKSATASASSGFNSAQSQDTNEWLAETNALTTEKQRQAVLERMPKNKKKKKGKTPEPVVASSSDSDVDSDSSDQSSEEQPNAQQKGQVKGKPPGKVKTNVVKVKMSDPDPNFDVLAQRTGFTQVGASGNKGQQNGMGLDTFGMDTGAKPTKTKSQTQQSSGAKQSTSSSKQASSGPKLPPVDIYWPLEDYQFRLACKSCFVKTGEGYKGYKLIPNYNHRCEKDVLIIKRDKDNNPNLNWMKIRPFPDLFTNRFNEFKMCQQFAGAQPCKIGEAKCTFPHNKKEMDLWYMEGDGDFSFSQFMNDLKRNNIDTSEQLAARQVKEKPASQNIPGLNFKSGARHRLSSPAPLAEPSQQGPPRTSMPPPAAPFDGFPPPNGAAYGNSKASLLGDNPLHSTGSPPPAFVSKPSAQPAGQPFITTPAEIMAYGDSALKDFDYKVVCPQCFLFEGFPGKYRYVPSTHVCEENVLAVKQKTVPGSPWVRVRERTNHRDFVGKYVMCHSVSSGDADLCRFGEFHCSFAHNEAEQQIWVMEKLGMFSITDFILKNRNAVSSRGFTVHELLKKYGGFFTFVCRNCFYGRPPRISEATPHNTCTGAMRHRWDNSSILAHVNSGTGNVTIIEPRKFTNKGAFFRICKYLQYCPKLIAGNCISAHSLLERDLWMLERDSNISREQIVQCSISRPPQEQLEQKEKIATKSVGFAAAAAGPPPQPQLPQATAGPGADSSQPKREKVPYTVREYCGLCWSNGTRSLEDGTTNRCVKNHSNFNIKRVFLIVGIYKELRNLPSIIPRNLNFVVCRYIQLKKKCQYVGQGPCQFAHSDEERVLWIWMARNRVTKLEDVVKQCLEDTKPVKINQGDSVVAASAVRVPTQIRMPTNLQNNAHYCRYCSVQANSERQWEEHCASEKHIFNVNSDKDHQWNFRQPPWGQGSNLSLCAKHLNHGRCPYSNVADMFNLCKYAHSQEELDEWKERFDWRQMKRSLAKEQNMFSFMEQLLERYNAADSRVTEMSETLTGVEVDCSQPLVVFRHEKDASLIWSFNLQSQMSLERVALLHHSARLHFYIQTADGSKHQITTGEQVETVDPRGKPCYTVNVHFTGGMFGSFNQWVVFDFGKKPVLLRKINVELGHKTVHDKVKDLRQKLAFARWTGENRQVIPYQYVYDDFTLSLTQRYKEPSSEVVVTQDSVRELNQHNYVHKMHKLLDLEEITRHKLISSFNMVNKAEVKEAITTEQHNTYHSRYGELFLRLPLTEDLTEDTGAGKLILTSVRTVLLTRNDFKDKHRVYEAMIEGKGKDYIFVSLSPVCVRELELKAGVSVEVEVQFQINRMHFINMHYALDLLENTDIVFPAVTKINPAFNEQHTLKISSKTLNKDQLQAVRHIVAERTGYTPPFIMYGPFGTGKTETLAQAAMVLLRERHDARILICAQSNSAADLYVTKHLDPFLRRSPGSQTLLLRIVSKDRRLTSIPESCRKYCCISSDGASFEIPPAHMVNQHRIVVTTVEMSLRLTSMQLKGTFTHIFIDEAAQALECETVMPLTLATEKTCVVLTGDHLQISPKVYSGEARRQNFGVSMLERLYEYYSNFSFQLQELAVFNPLNIFLSINYRTKMEILRFISATFYGGPLKLTAAGSIPSVVELTPMQFFAVVGREVQEADSTSFVNMAECSEVVERVITLLDDWPREWGRVAPEEIGVLTPYHDQVKQIRNMLKSHHRADLRSVNVEPVQNIQGKEFRALFISTVRTRNLLNSKHVAKALREAESVGGVADFAFLSDRKLLNTALTRTKSMVAVVGDPIALCAIGECIQIWRTYLKHCNNMRSIRPPNMSYDNIKSQVVSLQTSPMGRRLKEVTELCNNPDSPRTESDDMNDAGDHKLQNEVYVDDFEPKFGKGDAASVHVHIPSPSVPTHIPPPTVPTYIPPPSVPTHIPPPSVPVTSFAPASDGVRPAITQPAPLKPVSLKRSPLKPLGKLKMSKPVIEEFKLTDFAIKADEILLQMVLESLGGMVVQPLKVECVSVVIEDDQPLVTYNQQLANEELRMKRVQAAADGKEFDSDTEIYAHQDDDTGRVTKYYNYTEQTLKAVLHNKPDQYKRCIIHSNGTNFIAKVIDPLDSVQEIAINGLLCQGRAFDKDEVVVEILPAALDQNKLNEAVQGRVVGILQRAVDHRRCNFICSADSANTSLLTPVTPGAPSLYNVTLQKHLSQVKQGYVCVYRLSSDQVLSFSHYEKVEANTAENKLFVVRYLKWLPEFFNPLGVVVGVIPVGSNLSSAQKIVDIEHHLPQEFKKQVVDEVLSRFHNFTIPEKMSSQRSNLTGAWSFTVDTADATDLQVAFSIDQISDTSYQVCVHVTDVTFFVEAGSQVDKEAQERGASLLPIGRDCVPMLPSKLSSELCSFQPGQNRLALSIFMTVAGNGEDWSVVETSLRPTIINSKNHFSLQDVDSILDDIEGAENDYLKSCVLVLFQIALMQYKQRKGNAHLDPELGPHEMMAPRGHQMVHEVLLMANHQVASQLLKVFPQCTPLLQQAWPNRHKLEDWKAAHAPDAINSVALTRPFLDGNKVCTCCTVCMCVYGYMQNHQVVARDHFDIMTDVWREVVAASQQGLTHVIQKAVASPLNHPQAIVAMQELNSVIPPQQLICSGDLDPLQHGHYSLNLPCMTMVTSPLRSYVSIVVQRLVWAMIQDQPCPYSQPQLSALVAHCNNTQHRADSFVAKDLRVNVAAALQSCPLTLFPVVERLDEKTVRLCFPNMPCVTETQCDVSLQALCPTDMPALSTDAQQVKLTWQSRIYDIGLSSPSVGGPGQLGSVELCADRFVCQIPPFQWQLLLAAVREDNEEKQLATVPAVQSHVYESVSSARFAVDVSSEKGDGEVTDHFTEFSLSLHNCMMMQVQVTAGVDRGVLTPQLQLISLTPTLDICVEHGNNPASCFTKPGSSSTTSVTYMDETSYQQLMMPLLALEAAETAVCSQESAIVHNVTVKWSNEAFGSYTGGDASVFGQFSLSQAFCEERQIFLPGKSHGELESFGLEKSMPVPLDLLCVRYKGLDFAEDTKLDPRVSAMLKVGSPGTWVAHCVVQQVSHDQGMVTVRFQLVSSSVKLPSQLLDSRKASKMTCTLEYIPKTQLFRQMEYSVACLKSASRLARDVAVGRKPIYNMNQTDVSALMVEVGGQMNTDQKEAVETALKQPFTVITGPPGSGKTWIAVQLASIFVHRNRMAGGAYGAPMQVLVCASSDAALDVLSAFMLRLGETCPRVVRVYDEHLINQHYPVPRTTIPPSRLKVSGTNNPEQLGIGLHHVIRSPACRYAQQIQEYDQMFAHYPHRITDDQVKAYRALLSQAEEEELRQAEVVLATCSTAASPRMARGVNVNQIIIDSCESCMEPESLLPVIVMGSAQQLVLLGDQQQLAPTVRNTIAGSLGLGKSLLERYTDSAITLTKQYRMPQVIADVPSECFYGGRLSSSELGPGSVAQPIVFNHVMGEEESRMTETDSGVVESICNLKEAECVMRLVEGLVQKGIAVTRLVVLTQYTAHVQLIKQHLAHHHLASVPVYTVNQCQGREFDFVVLSACRSRPCNEVPQQPTSAWLQKHLGVTADPHQMNVAITRAREVLLVIGNKNLLQCHPAWKKLLDHCRKRNTLILDSEFSM